MRSFIHPALAIIAAALTVTACSLDDASPATTSSAASTESLYVGHWVWQPGSQAVVSCPGQADVVSDPSKALPNDAPAWFDMTAEAGGLEEVDVLGCQFHFTLSDGSATVSAGQSCDKFPDGKGGTLTATTQSATKTTRDGVTLEAHVVDTVDGTPCTMKVDGTATKSR